MTIMLSANGKVRFSKTTQPPLQPLAVASPKLFLLIIATPDDVCASGFYRHAHGPTPRGPVHDRAEDALSINPKTAYVG